MKNIHIAALAGVLGPSIVDLYDGITAGDPAGGLYNVAQGWTGYDFASGQFDPSNMMRYYGPAVVGVLTSKFLGKYVNRYLPKGINL